MIDNERNKLGNIHKEFTGTLGKYMCIRSYFMMHKNNSLSGKQYKINKYLSFILINKNIDNKYLVISHSVSIYEHISSNF